MCVTLAHRHWFPPLPAIACRIRRRAPCSCCTGTGRRIAHVKNGRAKTENGATFAQEARRVCRTAALDPEVAADRAKLSYVSDTMPGITRHSARNGFDYKMPDGSLVRDIDTLKRIRSLAIPPAWTDVWICPEPHGHIQAIGRDQRRPQAIPLPPALARRCATRPNTASCWPSPAFCQIRAPASKRT